MCAPSGHYVSSNIRYPVCSSSSSRILSLNAIMDENPERAPSFKSQEVYDLS